MYALCIDTGNSSSKLGVFEGDSLIKQLRIEKLRVKDVKPVFKQYKITHAIISTTSDSNQAVVRFLERNCRLITLDHTTALPITNRYKTPETLGRDRIAAAVAAATLYPGIASVVFDLGTCLNYEVVDPKGNYIGGNIAPGLDMRLRAMHTFTKRLPLVKPQWNKDSIGNSSENAIQNGAVYGTLMEIESFIRRMQEKYGRINVILTGGNADFFANHVNSEIFVLPNLVLIGLHKILKHNVA